MPVKFHRESRRQESPGARARLFARPRATARHARHHTYNRLLVVGLVFASVLAFSAQGIARAYAFVGQPLRRAPGEVLAVTRDAAADQVRLRVGLPVYGGVHHAEVALPPGLGHSLQAGARVALLYQENRWATGVRVLEAGSVALPPDAALD